ncbi:MAG: 50S ribosomal protein L31 [Clostridiaceae bacterium]|jgi:large subunit ribosomal protein L31|nr:50S ribosomal protein L31 [Clostridiaceae bacterium]
MKDGIHPNYGKCIVRCACGETFETGAIKDKINVDICSKCHPFYTGRQKLIDAGGRVDKFRKRMNQHQDTKTDQDTNPDQDTKPES